MLFHTPLWPVLYSTIVLYDTNSRYTVYTNATDVQKRCNSEGCYICFQELLITHTLIEKASYSNRTAIQIYG